MGRYLRTLNLFWRTSVAAEMEYRSNFVIALLSSIGGLVGSIFGVFLFYRGDYQFAGWTFDESLVVLGVFTVLSGVSNTLLTPNLNRIVQQVEDGTLDFVLLKPIDSQFWVSLRQLSPWGVPDILFGFAIVGYAFAQIQAETAVPADLSALALGMLPLVCGIFSLYSLWFLLASTSIWFVKVYNATEVLRGLLDAGRFPMSAYPVAWRFFFTFVVPVAFLTSVPARTVLGREEPAWLGGAFALSLVLFALSRTFWRVALRSYTSASS